MLNVPQGSFELLRYPVRPKETLRAWDAADELILNHLAEQSIDCQRPLLLNDAFGALAVALSKKETNKEAGKKTDQQSALPPCSITDSFLAQQACLENLKRNQLEPRSPLSPTTPLNGKYDLVIIKIQKSLAQLEDQLHRIRPYIDKHTLIIGGGMVKMIHNSTLKCFEKSLGPTTTSLASKKARLIFCNFDDTLAPPQNPYPSYYPLPDSDFQIQTHAGVFSQTSLDIGARFFLEHLPSDKQYKTIVDLACGNGVIGLSAAKKNKDAKLYFCDESFMAVESAESNFRKMFSDSREAAFVVDDCLSQFPKAKADLILNNPPFHQQNAIGDQIAWQMFQQSFHALCNGGELWVVGNRHLAYQQKLKRLFGNCETLAANNKFVILKAKKN